jgi:putative alpha-1,2-mannosidase
LVARILAEPFSDAADGLPGNDDLGAMSSWYVWASLGLYPALPGVGGFVVIQPAFDDVRVTLAGGTLHLSNERATPRADAVQSVTLDGQSWPSAWLPWEKLKGGAELEFRLGERPSGWATQPADFPPSYEDFSGN